MPEGDTLYRTAVTLRKAIQGRAVERVEANPFCLLDPARLAAMPGRRVEFVEARGKHLLMVFRDKSASGEPVTAPEGMGMEMRQGDIVLHTHLRMTGSWHVYRPGENWQKPRRCMKIALQTDAFEAICFSAPVVELMGARESIRLSGVAELGPDATRDEFDPEAAKARLLRSPETPIGVAVMNQRAMSGVGNVFKSEALFIQGVDPFRPVGALDEATLEGILEVSHRLLAANRLEGNRRTTSSLHPRERLWVYGRTGEPCRSCQTPIQARRQGLDGRTTYYCPRCQNVGRHTAASNVTR